MLVCRKGRVDAAASAGASSGAISSRTASYQPVSNEKGISSGCQGGPVFLPRRKTSKLAETLMAGHPIARHRPTEDEPRASGRQ